MKQSNTDTDLDAVWESLKTYRDQVAAETSGPELAALLHARSASLATKRSGSLEAAQSPELAASLELPGRAAARHSQRFVWAAAALVSVVVGTATLLTISSDSEPVRTALEISSPLKTLVAADTPLVFPPGDSSAATAFLSDTYMKQMPTPRPIPEGSHQIAVYGQQPVPEGRDGETTVGEAIRFLTLIDGSGPPAAALSSLQPSRLFDPFQWIVSGTQASWRNESTVTGIEIEGVDRAVLAETGNRPRVIAFTQGDRYVVLYGIGIDNEQLREIAGSLATPGQQTSAGNLSAWGLASLSTSDSATPSEASSSTENAGGALDRLGGISIALPDASTFSGPAQNSAWHLAFSLTNQGSTVPAPRLLRSGERWVVQTAESSERQVVMGNRDGSAVELRIERGPMDPEELLATFDSLRTGTPAEVEAAIRRRRASDATNDRAILVQRKRKVISEGGWIPSIDPGGLELSGVSTIGSSGPGAGHFPIASLPTLWNPQTGATISFASLGERALPLEVGLEGTTTSSVNLVGRQVTQLVIANDLGTSTVGRFEESPMASIQVSVNGEGASLLHAAIEAMTLDPNETWSLVPIPGFEPLPIGSAPALSLLPSKAPTDQATKLEFGQLPMLMSDGTPSIQMSVSYLDRESRALLAEEFFTSALAERVESSTTSYYRYRQEVLSDTGQRSIFIPGTPQRPAILIAAVGFTEEEMVSMAQSVQPRTEAEVNALFEPILR